MLEMTPKTSLVVVKMSLANNYLYDVSPFFGCGSHILIIMYRKFYDWFNCCKLVSCPPTFWFIFLLFFKRIYVCLITLPWSHEDIY